MIVTCLSWLGSSLHAGWPGWTVKTPTQTLLPTYPAPLSSPFISSVCTLPSGIHLNRCTHVGQSVGALESSRNAPATCATSRTCLLANSLPFPVSIILGPPQCRSFVTLHYTYTAVLSKGSSLVTLHYYSNGIAFPQMCHSVKILRRNP